MKDLLEVARSAGNVVTSMTVAQLSFPMNSRAQCRPWGWTVGKEGKSQERRGVRCSV